MSGDVQPRKRKDKKRKKEEESSSTPLSHVFSKEAPEDVNIHIHKEEGTGGGICAKIVFFILFSALIVLIGLIITEHRGLTDLDVVESESKYSQIFEGWIDNDKLDDHHTLDDHDNAHFDDEEHEDDSHTLDDHDDVHMDDEETNEQSEEEHTLDDHDTGHFDDDQSSPVSEEHEEDEESPEEESQRIEEYTERFRRNTRYRRQASEEDDYDSNITESQEEQEPDSSNIYVKTKVEDDDEDEMVDSKDEDDTDEYIANRSENIYEEDEENSKIEEDGTLDDSAEILEDDDNYNDDDENDIKEDSVTEEDIKADSKFSDEPEEYHSQGGDDDNTIFITSKTNDAISKMKEYTSQETEDEVDNESVDETNHENTSVEKSTEELSQKINENEDKEGFINDSSDDEDPSEKSYVQTKSMSDSKESTEEKIVQNENNYAKRHDEDHEDGNSGGSDNPGSSSSKRTPSTDLDDSNSEKLSDDNNDYEFAGVTNEDDWQIRKELDEAQLNLRNNAAYALKMFEKVLEKYPSSPRGSYGLAQALDALADKEKSNELLEEAISNYFKISELTNVPDPLYKASLERCIDRTRFRGKYGKAIRVHLKLINRFPDEPEYRNQLTITYLTIGKVEEARLVLEETLQKWPYNGCALVHYGFIWKTTDNNLEKGVYYMQKGIDTKDPCVIDGRFYFHLGDGYSRLGDSKKALKIYEEGVEHKLFLSKYQRSLYNVPRLTARPWWQNDQLLRYKILLEDLENHWTTIRNEGLAVLNQQGFFQDESENLKDTGDWKQLELFARGKRNIKNCNKTPFTCKLVASHIDASGCRRGQTKFSVMHPGTHVWPHCGPTNCRLRIHLGLKIPSNTFIRVGDIVRSWNSGKLLVFDDSFEHEVWHNGTDLRLVLIVDVWHPELTMTEKQTLSSL